MHVVQHGRLSVVLVAVARDPVGAGVLALEIGHDRVLDGVLLEQGVIRIRGIAAVVFAGVVQPERVADLVNVRRVAPIADRRGDEIVPARAFIVLGIEPNRAAGDVVVARIIGVGVTSLRRVSELEVCGRGIGREREVRRNKAVPGRKSGCRGGALFGRQRREACLLWRRGWQPACVRWERVGEIGSGPVIARVELIDDLGIGPNRLRHAAHPRKERIRCGMYTERAFQQTAKMRVQFYAT